MSQPTDGTLTDKTEPVDVRKEPDPAPPAFDSNGTEAQPKKPKMTDAERLELAAKLDSELDEFINGLERRPYTDGWDPATAEEEMRKHPFFMKEPPKEGEELHPLLEGIQQLKYDPEENTKEDLAENYRVDGNFYMKHKKFRMAIIAYTEGLSQKCVNDSLNATLYNNRSAANYYLQNYRSALNDALAAFKLQPDYMKAKIRAAHCYSHLKKFKECQELCLSILDVEPANTAVNDLMMEVTKKQVSALSLCRQ